MPTYYCYTICEGRKYYFGTAPKTGYDCLTKKREEATAYTNPHEADLSANALQARTSKFVVVEFAS